MMARRLLPVMRRMRRLLPDIMHRAGMDCRRLGGKDREPTAEEKRNSSSKRRDGAHRQAS